MTQGIQLQDGAVAFALTLGAGMCTCIGAAVVFNHKLVKYADNSFLAGSLSLSAGVMIYVSFIEIFQKSSAGFEDAGFSYGRSQLYATICFFCGIILGKSLDKLSHLVRTTILFYNRLSLALNGITVFLARCRGMTTRLATSQST